ncbi:MAG: hypothetical protein A2498_12445 [Lentisphaerae bacterium RIFOXYC12_FULL_60_16]|nr:MAG: hypothetical protein A2498_12445 [Lentisphaerae bacterium RIFOXYC12_FULL_60_16]OGV72220.1 MAG: hypothetical protein A2269_06515 [Lentisphaerae bacterium RIFOXYA12_FULL_60_10]OGV83591.1 MAG: hypothetical protein A2340_09515 [Lentisphaerae bacterium RIFOXYB12_FULL_60_10]
MAELEERRRQMGEAPTIIPEELKKQLESYQLELIRAGGAKGPPLPLPMPLTQEMDDRLVEEGVLAPAGDETPMKAVPYVPKTGLNEPPQADMETTLPLEE